MTFHWLQRAIFLVISAIFIMFSSTQANSAVSINAGAPYTKRAQVDVSITPPDTSYTLMSVSTDNIRWGKWLPLRSTFPSKLDAGEGVKTLYVKYKTAEGKESSVESDTIVVDTKVPNAKITINRVETNSRTVAVTFNVTDLSPITELQYAAGSNPWSPWVPYATTKDIELPAGDGLKVIKVKFRDAAGNISLPAMGKIILDTTPPSGTVLINKGAVRTHSATVTASVKSGGKPAQLKILVDGTPVNDWQTFAPTFTLTLAGSDGERSIGVLLRDTAGNESASITDTIILATSPAAYAGRYVGLSSTMDAFVDVTVDSNGSISGTATPYNNLQKIQLSGTVDGAGILAGTGTPDGWGEPPTKFTGTVGDKMDFQVKAGPAVTLAKIPTSEYAKSYAGEYSFNNGNLSGSLRITSDGAVTGTIMETTQNVFTSTFTYTVSGLVTNSGTLCAVAERSYGGFMVIAGKFSGADTISWNSKMLFSTGSVLNSGTGIPFVRKVKSDSFDPQTAKSPSTGKNLPLYWVYKVNNGNPIDNALGGYYLRLTPAPLVVTQNPDTMKRTTSFSGVLSGNVNGVNLGGNYNATLVQSIATTNNVSVMSEQLLTISAKVTWPGSSTSGNASIKINQFTTPYQMLLDRNDLDSLPEFHEMDLSTNGKKVFASSHNLGLPNLNEYSNIYDGYVIHEKLQSMTINNKTYYNVIHVRKFTNIYEYLGSGFIESSEYWMAKGIGIIRARNLMMHNVNFMNNFTGIELVDTNLNQ